MECQILIPWEKMKNNTSLSSAELAQRVVMVKSYFGATYRTIP